MCLGRQKNDNSSFSGLERQEKEMKADKRLEQLFKRVGSGNAGEQIENMPDDYKRGFYDGFVQGRDTQRKSDIQVAKSMVSQFEGME